MNRIGIDLGGTKIEGVVLSDNNIILVRTRIPTPRYNRQEESYRKILEAIKKLIHRLEHVTGTICSVGIGTPGTISSVTGLVKNSNSVCLNGKPLQNDLEQMIGRKIRIANDANCFALSESRNGAARGYASAFGIIMGTGVGGGIVIDGKIHNGAMGIAGEWGHNPLLLDGPACYCGRYGCVETLISGPGFSAYYERAGGVRDTSPLEIVSSAKSGDIVAISCVNHFLNNFGRAVASVVNVIDPHVIVLGGGLSNLDILYDRGRNAIEPHIFSDGFTTPVLKNQHGDSSGVLGAAYLWD